MSGWVGKLSTVNTVSSTCSLVGKAKMEGNILNFETKVCEVKVEKKQ